MDLPLHFALMHLWARSRRRPNNTRTILGVRALVLTAATCAPHAAAAFAPQQAASDNPASVNYQNNRLQFRSSDGRFAANVQHRLQFRYAYPFDIDPRSPVDFDKASSSFFVRRARLKLDGHAFWPWLEWNLQYDWAQPVLRDLSFMVSKVSWFRVLLGQRKVCWNDERVTSSARQQFINRSIVNDIFTVDRQQGIQISGRVLPGSWYNDDAHMMYAGRLQWNVLGDALDFSQSDVEYHERPAASLAFGAATNTSGCTAYETDRESCRALTTTRSDGVQFASPQEAAGRYKLQQGFAEFRLKWRGLYAKHESHLKRVTDKAVADGAPGRTTVLRGKRSQRAQSSASDCSGTSRFDRGTPHPILRRGQLHCNITTTGADVGCANVTFAFTGSPMTLSQASQRHCPQLAVARNVVGPLTNNQKPSDCKNTGRPDELTS